jgi:DNA-binding GntR family transcriptional regulator
MRRLAHAQDGLGAALAHADFHRAVGRASGMRRAADFIDALVTQMLASHGYGTTAYLGGTPNFAVEHLPILQAIEARDAPAAERAMKAHFAPVEPMIHSYHQLRDRVDHRSTAASRSDEPHATSQS